VIGIRLLRDVAARNIIGEQKLYAGEAFLARELTPFEYRRWEPHFGRELPKRHRALLVCADGGRVATGEAIFVGVEGLDWEATGRDPS
jgi:hypothetical protein